MGIESETFRWRVHPFRERKVASVLAIGSILAASAATGLAAGDWIWSGPALVALFLALNRFFLPSHFEINETGLKAAYPFKEYRLSWSQVNSVKADAYLAMLRPQKLPLLLGRFSKEVLARLEQYVPKRMPPTSASSACLLISGITSSGIVPL